jgi:uncharacterized peroxidase-related enzyme
LRSLGGAPEELKEQLVRDYRTAKIDSEDRQILEFVEELTLRPGEITEETIQPLKQLGFDARMLHDIVQVAAYFAYVNRIADGLGVELEK